jgi:hypothetical protein
LSDKALLSYITPNSFLKNLHSKEPRRIILSNSLIEIINFSAYKNNDFDLSEAEKVFHLQSEFQNGDFDLEIDIDSNLRKTLANKPVMPCLVHNVG